MTFEGDKEQSPVVGYTFRYKKKVYGTFPRYISEIFYANGKRKLLKEDIYNKFFLNQLCLRDCCGDHCPFRSEPRMGDITIADFNNRERLFPYLHDNRSYSTVVFNTEQGKLILPDLEERMNLLDCDIESIRRYNPLFCRTTQENPQRSAFFTDYLNGTSLLDLKAKYVPKKKIYPTNYIPWHIKHYALFIATKLRGKK